MTGVAATGLAVPGPLDQFACMLGASAPDVPAVPAAIALSTALSAITVPVTAWLMLR